jgi:hypothetical protein
MEITYVLMIAFRFMYAGRLLATVLGVSAAIPALPTTSTPWPMPESLTAEAFVAVCWWVAVQFVTVSPVCREDILSGEPVRIRIRAMAVTDPVARL